MGQQAVIRPVLRLMRPEQIADVHRHSVELLSRVGVRVDSEAARTRLRQAHAESLTPDGYWQLAPELVDWALSVAPAFIDIYDQRGAPAFRLGPDEPTRFGIGVTALYYQDPMTDELEPFGRRHMAQMAQLGDALPSLDAISTVGVIQDVPPAESDLIGTLELAANSVKPLVLLVSDEPAFPAALDLLEVLRGDLAARPCVIPYLNPISPLVLNQGTADKLISAVERGLPVIYSNYGMAGATTPLDPAGTLVLLNAELLAGLTFSQLVRQGAPVILGSLPAYFDMRGAGSFYDPASYLINLACAEMMAHYRLPHCGTSGSGMGYGPDLVASANQWMNHLTACIGRVGLAPFVGDNLGAKGFAPAIAVYADEIIAQARRFAAGFSLEHVGALLDEIAEVGPGGHFLISGTTLRQMRTAGFRSAILENLSMEAWQAQGCPQAAQRLRERTRAMLDSLRPPAEQAALLERGEAFIDRWRARKRA